MLLAAGVAMAGEGGSSPPAWLYKLVVPMGITTLVLLLCTFTLGLVRRLLGRKFLKLHLTLATLTVISAITHGSLVLTLY